MLGYAAEITEREICSNEFVSEISLDTHGQGKRPCRHIVKFVISLGFLRTLGFVLFTQFILAFQKFQGSAGSRSPAMRVAILP